MSNRACQLGMLIALLVLAQPAASQQPSPSRPPDPSNTVLHLRRAPHSGKRKQHLQSLFGSNSSTEMPPSGLVSTAMWLGAGFGRSSSAFTPTRVAFDLTVKC